MSSQTKGQLVIFTCDQCASEQEASGTWKDVWEDFNSQGWRAYKDVDGMWCHKCPECAA